MCEGICQVLPTRMASLCQGLLKQNTQTLSGLWENTLELFLQMVVPCTAGEVLLSELGNGISEIVINNPSTRGSLTGSMMLQLARIVDTLCPPPVPHRVDNSNQSASPTTNTAGNTVSSAGDVSGDTLAGRISTVRPRGLLIRGTGGMFSSGANFDMCTSLLQAPEQGLMMLRFMTDALTLLRTAPFVSVSVVITRLRNGLWCLYLLNERVDLIFPTGLVTTRWPSSMVQCLAAEQSLPPPPTFVWCTVEKETLCDPMRFWLLFMPRWVSRLDGAVLADCAPS